MLYLYACLLGPAIIEYKGLLASIVFVFKLEYVIFLIIKFHWHMLVSFENIHSLLNFYPCAIIIVIILFLLVLVSCPTSISIFRISIFWVYLLIWYFFIYFLVFWYLKYRILFYFLPNKNTIYKYKINRVRQIYFHFFSGFL